ncbi:STAS domain-containing protein [Pseudonocardia xishanensis]|uniref:STAS domain-containing protein n=1 Tax=Pseudonocardia xishanensis TaxID=630995 RepID=A0ABP8RTN9_9PSEU
MNGPWPFPEGWSLRVVEHDAGVTRLEVCGDIDTVTVEPLTDTVRALIREGETVVVDLTQVTYFGSRGLAMLLEADGEARVRGARLVVVPGAGNRTVTRPLELTRLDGVLDVRSVRDRPVPEDAAPPIGTGLFGGSSTSSALDRRQSRLDVVEAGKRR